MGIEGIGGLLLQVILSSGEYNGHLQTTLNELHKTIALGLCEFLEENLHNPVYLKLYSDGGGSIYQEDCWEEGEHPSGHRDRLLIGIDHIT